MVDNSKDAMPWFPILFLDIMGWAIWSVPFSSDKEEIGLLLYDIIEFNNLPILSLNFKWKLNEQV